MIWLLARRSDSLQTWRTSETGWIIGDHVWYSFLFPLDVMGCRFPLTFFMHVIVLLCFSHSNFHSPKLNEWGSRWYVSLFVYSIWFSSPQLATEHICDWCMSQVDCALREDPNCWLDTIANRCSLVIKLLQVSSTRASTLGGVAVGAGWLFGYSLGRVSSVRSSWRLKGRPKKMWGLKVWQTRWLAAL